MSGSNHTAPLDLTNKTRELRPTDDQRHTPEKQLETARKCRNGQGIGDTSNACPTDDPKTMGQTRPITPQTSTARKPTDSSFSKLPIRKRPFPVDAAGEREPPSKLKEERCSPKEHQHLSQSDRCSRRTGDAESPFMHAFPGFCKLLLIILETNA